MKLRNIAAATCIAGLAAGTAVSATTAAAIPAAPHGPKNVIVLIGDGMGYTHMNNTSLYEHGQAYKQVSGTPGNVEEIEGTPSYVYQNFPVQVDMATFSEGGSYDPEAAWTDFDYVKSGATDSAAAGTAMATGSKTNNGTLGLDADGNVIENLSERAIAMGKAAGSISSVPYSHATPAAYVAHAESRNDYHGIANQEVYSELDVIMGGGHPFYNDDNELLDDPKYRYISEEDFNGLKDGVNGWTLVEEKADFEALTSGDTPDRVFGIPQVGSTLQQGRSGNSDVPYGDELNDVPSLATMTEGALNVLDNNENGFHLQVEGGAIDWAGHANDTARDIEETQDFNAAVDSVVEWVEENSNWRETLVIVTADHETGYLEGHDSDPNWSELLGTTGATPDVSWHSGGHTNQLVPVYAKGAGAKELARLATETDPVRGEYLDNTDLANLLLEDLWAENNKGKAKGRYNGNDKQGDVKTDNPNKGKGNNNGKGNR